MCVCVCLKWWERHWNVVVVLRVSLFSWFCITFKYNVTVHLTVSILCGSGSCQVLVLYEYSFILHLHVTWKDPEDPWVLELLFFSIRITTSEISFTTSDAWLNIFLCSSAQLHCILQQFTPAMVVSLPGWSEIHPVMNKSCGFNFFTRMFVLCYFIFEAVWESGVETGKEGSTFQVKHRFLSPFL